MRLLLDAAERAGGQFEASKLPAALRLMKQAPHADAKYADSVIELMLS